MPRQLDQSQGNSLNQTRNKKVLLLGSGISKSISPSIQNKAFHELGLGIEYELCDISEDLFDSKLAEIIRDDRIIGFNVTIPFKERVISHIKVLDPRAQVTGAVNLVVISTDRRRLTGFNTDVDGVIASLSKLGLIGRSGQVGVILGSGGASRACIYALLTNGFDSLTILNRSEKRAVEVARHFSGIFPGKKINHAELTEQNLRVAMQNASLLVNTIPMTAEIPFEVDFTSAPQGMKYLDLNYRKNPPLLRAAKRKGISAIEGSLMLVEQAARSFEILTGISAPRKTMMLAAKKVDKTSVIN